MEWGHIHLMRPGYFMIWLPIIAFAWFLLHATFYDWVGMFIPGLVLAAFGLKLTLSFRRHISEEERHLPASTDTPEPVDPFRPQAANSPDPPFP